MLTFTIKSAVVLAALYIPYTLLLRSETFVRFNRAVLLTIMLLSVALPLVNIPFLAIEIKPTATIEFGELTMQILDGENTAKNPLDIDLTQNNSQLPSFNYQFLFSLIYLAGVLAVLAVRTMQLAALRRRIKCGCLWTQAEDDGTTIYCHAGNMAPYSWFKQIVVSQADLDDCGETILAHERAHAALNHSADMLLAMAIQALQWFNPFIWLLTDSLQEIHEYEADRQVLTAGTDIRQYQLLLIKKTVGRAWPAFTNSLKSNQLKNRFKMMLQKQSSPWRRARVLYVLPIALAALSVFATNNKTNTPPQPFPQEEGAGQSLFSAEKDSVLAVDTCAEQILVLEGACIDEEKNVVEFKGAYLETTTNHQPTPITPSSSSTTRTDSKTQKLENSRTYTDDYLIIVDGVPQENAKLEDFNKDDIYSMCVIKDEDAKKPFVEKYGAKAKTAVVLITMKDDRVFDICEEFPEYPGGQEAMYRFLAQNMSYPKEAMEQGLQGRVMLSFIVEKDGSLNNIKVISMPGADWKAKEYEIEGVTVTGYGKNADGSIVTEQQKEAIVISLYDEAKRVLQLMPNWNPGKQRGKFVRVKMTLPIMFRLS